MRFPNFWGQTLGVFAPELFFALAGCLPWVFHPTIPTGRFLTACDKSQNYDKSMQQKKLKGSMGLEY